jgi:hypothetical protein
MVESEPPSDNIRRKSRELPTIERSSSVQVQIGGPIWDLFSAPKGKDSAAQVSFPCTPGALTAWDAPWERRVSAPPPIRYLNSSADESTAFEPEQGPPGWHLRM